MRLLNLTIRNFRGFGNATASITLDGDLLLFFGPNGFGKTSLAEAIEWLFYGTTKRRQQGESYSRSEYANSFANVHGGIPTEVSATVQINGRQVILARRLTQGEASETFIDGTIAPFSSISINPIEAVYPVVAQHGLQTFVHSKPKDRRDAICAALGLDELTSLKNTLDSARSSFQRSPPRVVADARSELASRVSTLAEISETQELARRWRMSPPIINLTSDLDALRAAAAALTRVECDTVEAALMNLRERRLIASRSVFDAEKLRPNDGAIASIESELHGVEEALVSVEGAIGAVVASLASAYGAAFLDLWKKGLELSPTGDQCPMCEEHTLTADKRRQISKRLADNAEQLAKNAQLATAINATKLRIARLKAQMDDFNVVELTEGERVQLANLFVDQIQMLEEYFVKTEAFRAKRALANETLVAATAFLNDCILRLHNPLNAPDVVEQSTWIKSAIQQLEGTLVVSFRSYVEAWLSFGRELTTLISSNEFVARIDAVGKSLRAEPQLRMLDRYDSILRETQELIRAVEQEMQTRQAALLTTRGAEVKDLYDRLNREANVVFDHMEPGTDSMKLHATSFGTPMSAAANLSECQLNCLGLAMWLMRATTPSSPFGFVLLDDPVQSMDDDHTEAFISDIVPHLLDDHGKQVIVLSHVKRLTDRLRELNTTRQVKLYHYESFERAGPTVTEQIALQMLLAEIRGGSRGNEQNRKYCVDRIRVLIEHFVRELHLSVVGVPLPSQYDQATARELLPVFQAIPGTTPQEHVALRDTVRFCDPAHHTQVGYAVPVQSNIQPHIGRMEGLLRKYSL
jgi:ABC-type Mn2+/Zn2+ transport system ATPase subunit